MTIPRPRSVVGLSPIRSNQRLPTRAIESRLSALRATANLRHLTVARCLESTSSSCSSFSARSFSRQRGAILAIDEWEDEKTPVTDLVDPKRTILEAELQVANATARDLRKKWEELKLENEKLKLALRDERRKKGRP